MRAIIGNIAVSLITALVAWAYLGAERNEDIQGLFRSLHQLQLEHTITSTSIDQITKELVSHNKDIEQLKDNSVKVQSQLGIKDSNLVFLDAASRNYVVAKTSHGVLFISVISVAPYLNGQKLTLNIGNPSSATYSGAKIKARWNKAISKDLDNAEKWLEGEKSKEFSITDALVGGAWNKVEVILSPAKPEELGFLGFEIAVDQVLLRQR